MNIQFLNLAESFHGVPRLPEFPEIRLACRFDWHEGTVPPQLQRQTRFNNSSSRYAILRIMPTRELLSFLRLVLKPGLNF